MTERIIPKDFYVYMHLKATTKEPFYIGKGRGRRATSPHSRSRHWKSVAGKHGFEVEFVQTNLSELQAFDLERDLIKQHGRKDLGQGALVNMTDGGDGTSGAITPDHVRKIQSETAKRLNADPEFKEKVRAINLIRLNTAEEKQRMSERAKVINSNPAVRAAASVRMAALHADPEFKAAHALRLKERWNNPEFRKNATGASAKCWKDPEYKVNRVAKMVASMAKKVKCLETGEVFESGAAAARWVKTQYGHEHAGSSICMVCKGKKNKAYGHTWAYA